MNPVKIIYCRAFQFVFRTAMPFLPYREPEVLDSMEKLEQLLTRRESRCVMLVTDQHIRTAGITRSLEEWLEEAGARCVVYDHVQPNPTVHNVEQARDLYVREGCQCLIAVGGGSAMDCAKGVGARIAFPKKSLEQMKGLLRVWRPLPPIVAIPTTAGTGSEVTVTAVITDPEKKYKYTMNNFTMIPHYVVHDPAVTYTLPPALTATTGMDALTHAVEAYIGGSTTEETRRLALEAVGLVFKNIEIAYTDSTNYDARKNMLRAAYLAGIAFSKSYVGYIHAVAHSLGGRYNTPHGLANAVLMPFVLEEYGPTVYRKLHELAVAAGVSTPEDSHQTGAKALIAAIRTLNRRMGIPDKLSGIQKQDIPQMAKHADQEANPLYPVPVLMDAKQLERFYYQVADWS